MKLKTLLPYRASILAAAILAVSTNPAVAGPNSCYAKALPTRGHGGQAWAADLVTAKSMALDFCRKYASETGGTPETCKIVEASCKKDIVKFGEVVTPSDKSQ